MRFMFIGWGGFALSRICRIWCFEGCNGCLTKNYETHPGSAGASGTAVALHVRDPNALGFPISNSRQTEIVLRRLVLSTWRKALMPTCSDPSVGGHLGRVPMPGRAWPIKEHHCSFAIACILDIDGMQRLEQWLGGRASEGA